LFLRKFLVGSKGEILRDPASPDPDEVGPIPLVLLELAFHRNASSQLAFLIRSDSLTCFGSGGSPLAGFVANGLSAP